MIRRAIEQGGTEEQGSIRAVIETTGGLDYTAELAGREVEKALAALADVPASSYREALSALARFAATREN
jgi:octaprenyl-diphosphate synthase